MKIYAGDHTSFYKNNINDVYCWGYNENNILGISSDNIKLPKLLLTLSGKVLDIKSGSKHTAIITEDNILYMIGSNEYGQLGTGDIYNRNRFTEMISIDKNSI